VVAAAAFETCFPSTPPDPSVVRGKELLANLLASLRKTAAATTALDEQVGAVIAKLTQRKLLDRTLVVFTSTCGSLCGRHGIWGGGDSTEPPNMFEETVGTPMIWRWPSRLPPQTTRPESVSACDFVPSICDLAGITLDKLGLCGRSYAALATGLGLPKGQTWGNLAFSHLKDTDMARDSRYKLVLRNGGKGPNEFYDLQTDPSELTNAYDDAGYASVRPALAEAIAKWKQACSA